MKIKILSVFEVNNYLKKIIDNDFILNNLSVKGEISNLKYHSSGHIYFSLKDNTSKINCVMFKSSAIKLSFKLKEGMNVIVSGRVSVYPEAGSLQLYCNDIEEDGIGKLYIEFEKLKEKLSNLGYFDLENKKEIPKIPRRIGIVTSSTGAVFHDIKNVTRRRNDTVSLVLYPAKVQGIGAFKEIISGIKYFNKVNSVDVIILARGGGSIEELWNFNEEELAKEIFKSNIPIISAVGHEVDFTISDFVSDARAATPSQAAEIAVPMKSDILNEIDYVNIRLNNYIKNRFKAENNKLDSLNRILKLNSPMSKIANSYLEINKIQNRMNYIMKKKLEIEKEKLFGLNNLLIANNPVNLLTKGYAIIEDEFGIISSKDSLSKEKDIYITLKDGTVQGRFRP